MDILSHLYMLSVLTSTQRHLPRPLFMAVIALLTSSTSSISTGGLMFFSEASHSIYLRSVGEAMQLPPTVLSLTMRK